MSDGLSFDLRLSHPGFDLHMAADLPGQGVTALVGPSGSGKTTLLQALAGLEAAQGHVTLAGRALHPLPPHRRGVAVVFQNARLFGHLDVAGNIWFGAARRGTPPAQVARIVEALDLGPLMGRAVSRLSGGEVRRVALARALAASPALLLLDEPLSGLDRQRRSEILPYLARAIRSAGCPALFVTHDADESLTLADRRLSVRAGRIVGALPQAAVLPLERIAQTGTRARLGDTWLQLPHQVRPGERWGMVINPERAILARDTVPALDTVSIPARIHGAERGELMLEIAGQRLAWQTGDMGDRTWLTPGGGCVVLIRAPLFRLLDSGCDSPD